MGKPTNAGLASDAAAYAARVTALAVGTDNTAETGTETSLTGEIAVSNGISGSSVDNVATVSGYSDAFVAEVIIAEVGAYEGAALADRDVLASTVTVPIGSVAVVSFAKTYQSA